MPVLLREDISIEHKRVSFGFTHRNSVWTLTKYRQKTWSKTYLDEMTSTWIQDLPTPSFSLKRHTATLILKFTQQSWLSRRQKLRHTWLQSTAKQCTKSSKPYQLQTLQIITVSQSVLTVQVASERNVALRKPRADPVASSLHYERTSTGRQPLFALDTWQYDKKTDNSAASDLFSAPTTQGHSFIPYFLALHALHHVRSNSPGVVIIS